MKSASQIAELLKDFIPGVKAKPAAVKMNTRMATTTQPIRKPYAFNLGLDFGTAFTKCMLRDLRQERARPVAFNARDKISYLLPSELYLDDGGLLHTPLEDEGRGAILGCLKMALYAAVGDRRGDSWLLTLARQWPEDDEATLHVKIEALVIYYLAAVIRHCRNAMIARQPDFGSHHEDTFSVNMAVPIAHVQESGVEEAFLHCLNRAWRVAQDLPAGPTSLADCLNLAGKLRQDKDEHLCAVYPEVSANVQAYIQSRSGFEGLFMFVDVGAGTVDSSAFIYWPRATDGVTLSYFAAEVMPLGSSQIELRAAADLATRILAEFRRCKEGAQHEKNIAIEPAVEVKRVCATLEQDLLDALGRCAGLAFKAFVGLRRRRASMQQWHSLRVLLGGGGSVLEMYRQAAGGAFTTWAMKPETTPLPLPIDIDWPFDEGTDRESLFRRMTVAYGLSFDFPALDKHRLPGELEQPSDEGEQPSERYCAPSKDEV